MACAWSVSSPERLARPSVDRTVFGASAGPSATRVRRTDLMSVREESDARRFVNR